MSFFNLVQKKYAVLAQSHWDWDEALHSDDFRDVFRHWWGPDAFSSRRFSSRNRLQQLLEQEPAKSWRIKEHLPLIKSKLQGKWLFRAEKRGLNIEYSFVGPTLLTSKNVTSWTTELNVAQFFSKKTLSVIFVAKVPFDSILYVPYLDDGQMQDILSTREKEILVSPAQFEGYAFEYSRATGTYDVGDDRPYDEREFIEMCKHNKWI